MFRLLKLMFGLAFRAFRCRRDLLLENLALRQQILVFERRSLRLKLPAIDKLFWVVARKLWSGWKESLFVVTPETVVRWHRAGFRLYWSFISQYKHVGGRRKVSKDLREIIFRMIAENRTWGAPRIHGELLALGFDISERTVSRWMQRAPKDPKQGNRWKAFLRNHREVIAAMDFFTVPTINFRLLYCLFVIGHDRRRILHFNATAHPTSCWVIEQLREVFPFEPVHKYLIFDRDQKFGLDVIAAVKATGIIAKRTSFRSLFEKI